MWALKLAPLFLATGILSERPGVGNSDQPSSSLQRLIDDVIEPRAIAICPECLSRCKAYTGSITTHNLKHYFPRGYGIMECGKICSDILHADLFDDVVAILQARADGTLRTVGGDKIWNFITPETESIVRTEIQEWQCYDDYDNGDKPPPTSGPGETFERRMKSLYGAWRDPSPPPPVRLYPPAMPPAEAPKESRTVPKGSPKAKQLSNPRRLQQAKPAERGASSRLYPPKIKKTQVANAKRPKVVTSKATSGLSMEQMMQMLHEKAGYSMEFLASLGAGVVAFFAAVFGLNKQPSPV